MLVALIIASSFFYDSVRDRVVGGFNAVVPPTARRSRANRYALFAVRKLPEWTAPAASPLDAHDLLDAAGNPLAAPQPQPAITFNLSVAEGAVRQIAGAISQTLLSVQASAAVAHSAQPPQPQFSTASNPNANAAAAAAAQAIEAQVAQMAQVGSALGRQAAARLARAQDSLPFPAPSVRRRVVAWTVDSLAVSMLASAFKGFGMRGTAAAILWLGRDLWLSPLGLSSPGRWIAGQVALSTRVARQVNADFAPVRDPGLLGENPSLTAFLNHQQAAVVDHLAAARWHDLDTYALVSHNALRLLLGALGPLASLVWAGSTVGTYLTAPAGMWDGRTLWDRWAQIQVVDEEVLLGWATTGIVLNRGGTAAPTTTAAGGAGADGSRSLPQFMPSGYSDFGLPHHHQSQSLRHLHHGDEDDEDATSPIPPSFESIGSAEMFVPPSQYFGSGTTPVLGTADLDLDGVFDGHDEYPDPDDADPISPPPMAPVRDSFFGGHFADLPSPTGPEPYYPFPSDLATSAAAAAAAAASDAAEYSAVSPRR
ncbi:hypothetical protein H9P43_010021 [Blastocladiella emersonii ATCC 22665]|nr:hypothetical protein H9P43_010021 [Blastocladiella emersonii ATCC 22665]